MSEDATSRTRFRLEEARFFLENMTSNLQRRKEFRYYLDAFLSSARSVLHVFESESHDNGLLLKWYKEEAEVKKNPVVKFFIRLRNISLKENTPDTRTRVAVEWTANVSLTEKDVGKVVDSDGKERWLAPLLPLEVKNEEVIGYHFVHNFEWFNEIPDVMNLCKKYLDELEKFVLEAEHISEKEGVRP